VNATLHIRAANPIDADAIARVHVESWRTTYRGIVPDAFLAGLSIDQRAETWASTLRDAAEQTCVYVLEDVQGTILGFASGGPERTGDAVYSGELYAIYLLAAVQRHGAGRLLFMTVVRQLVTTGKQGVLAWVVASNPSCRFYEALGGDRVRVRQEAIGGIMLGEIAYGWTDTSALLARHDDTPSSFRC